MKYTDYTTNIGGISTTINQTAQPLAPALEQNFPEVRLCFPVIAGMNSFLITATINFTESKEALLIFLSFRCLVSLYSGNKNDQLQNIYSIAITEKLAKKLFGNEIRWEKLLKLIWIDNFIVTGILKNLPSNTRFTFEYLLPWDI